ncbi:unnamed protein product [Closterium sp. NIES-54]
MHSPRPAVLHCLAAHALPCPLLHSHLRLPWHLFVPFPFPVLGTFARIADLIAHLRLLDASYRAANTVAQLAILPSPMPITINFIATSLPGRLASVRDALLPKHPTELTIKVLESALMDKESNIRSDASASGAIVPLLFQGCTVLQLPTFMASRASIAYPATGETAVVSTVGGRSRGKGGKKGGKDGGAGGGGGGDAGSGGGGDGPAPS